jgi:hypothetical protein
LALSLSFDTDLLVALAPLFQIGFKELSFQPALPAFD